MTTRDEASVEAAIDDIVSAAETWVDVEGHCEGFSHQGHVAGERSFQAVEAYRRVKAGH